ncbi:6-phosphogluconolactonase [Candidatus Pacebacteria bacterium]|nr:6-phosphogluconolactonase [Candidatus Paceibacterota bacterium]
MNIHSADNQTQAAALAAKHIESVLQTDRDHFMLVLSGGSAFNVIKHLSGTYPSKQLTLLLADERFTSDVSGSNYLQLTQTDFFKRVEESPNSAAISTTPNLGDASITETAFALEKTLRYYLQIHPDTHIIALLGIGEDGHTASIFPNESKEVFDAVYTNDHLYIPVSKPDDRYPERMTITPYFISHLVDDVVIYAVGKEKCENVISELVKDNRSVHELPAAIAAGHPRSNLFTDCQLYN